MHVLVALISDQALPNSSVTTWQVIFSSFWSVSAEISLDYFNVLDILIHLFHNIGIGHIIWTFLCAGHWLTKTNVWCVIAKLIFATIYNLSNTSTLYHVGSKIKPLSNFALKYVNITILCAGAKINMLINICDHYTGGPDDGVNKRSPPIL